MMFKRMIVLTVALLIIFPAITSAKDIKKLGQSPLMKISKKGISSAEELKTLVEKFKDRIKEGFEQAGLSVCYQAFLDQINAGAVQEKIVPKGQKIPWMLSYSHKKVKMLTDVVWEGKKTFNAFVVDVNCDCKDYEFIVPKACGNVSLFDQKNGMANCNLQVSPTKAKVGDPIKVDLSGSKCAAGFEVNVTLNGKDVDYKKLTGGTTQCEFTLKDPGEYTITSKAFNADGIASQSECNAKIEIERILIPPTCDLKVVPTKGYVGQVIKLDASGSSDKDGQVVKADFAVTGKENDKKSVTAKPFIWDKVFNKSGIYAASVEVTDNDNLTSKNTCNVTGIEIQKRFYGIADIGPMVAKGTYTGFAFARLGFCYLIDPEIWDVIVSAGYAVKLGGHNFKSHFLGNAVLDYHISDFFIGAGVGYSSKVRLANPKDPIEWKAAFNIVGNIGFDVFKSLNQKGSIFIEGRLPVIKGLKIKDAHEILLGFRYMF